jgi:hypothetical protein
VYSLQFPSSAAMSSLLLAILVSVLCAASAEVIQLDSKNFEHLTQAASGATTGDWLVKFYAPWYVKFRLAASS